MKKSLLLMLSLFMVFLCFGCTKEEEPKEALTITKLSYQMTVSDTLDLEYVTDNLKDGTNVIVESKDETIVSCDGKTLCALKAGTVNIEVYLSTDTENKFTISVTVIDKPVEKIEVKIMNKKEKVDLYSVTALISYISNEDKKSSLTWTSSDENIISIDKDGNMTAVALGKATITLSLADDTETKDTMEVEVVFNPMAIFDTLAIENVLVQNVTSYGNSTATQVVVGSVVRYSFSDLNLIENIVPVNTNIYTGQVATEEIITAAESLKKVRSGILHNELKYIVYHDTGNNTAGANALMHANYMVGDYNAGDRARSWHYTVDENCVIHHIPDNEVTWQGDSYEAYAKSIGIETCVDYGCNLYKVWQRAGKLMASLIDKYDMDISCIKQHYDMNGKDCPKTLRNNNLYSYAVSLIEGELLVKQMLGDYDISFESLSPEYLDNTGLVIKQPTDKTRLAYKITITGDDYEESKVYYSTIKGSENNDEDSLNESDLVKAMAFDEKVAALDHTITKDDNSLINGLIKEYNELSEEVKDLVVTHTYLINKETELLNLYRNEEASVIINSIFNMGSTNNSGYLGYNYIQLYNASDGVVSLKDMKLNINGASVYTFNDISLKAHTYLLIGLGDMKASSNGNGYAFACPDIAIDYAMPENNYNISIVSGTNTLDTVGVGSSSVFEGTAAIYNDNALALTRKVDFDTDNNSRDFELVAPTPINSLGKGVEEFLDEAYNIFDYKVIKLNRELTLDDETSIDALMAEYETFDSEDKTYIKNYSILEDLNTEIEGLKNPSVKIVNDVIKQIPSRIVSDFVLPVVDGVTYAYADNEDTSYYNITTGEYLKLSYEAKMIKIVVSHGNITEEVLINFGIASTTDKLIFSTGSAAPAGGKTSDGYGTVATQTSTAGFGDVAIIIDSKVFFIGKDCLINLTKPETGNTLSKEELRPLGGVNFINNIGIVNGTPTEYKGTGALYYNSSDVALKFDLSDTYGRNNSGAYGYFKVVFAPSAEGGYKVKEIMPNSGTNDTTNNVECTLQPGEYLWTPHTYETNVNGGTWLIYPGTSTSGGVLIEGEALEIIKYKHF